MTGAVTVGWDAAVLEAAIAGRATGPAIETIRAALEEAVGRGRPFVVLFDRRRLTAPDAGGRAALERWGAELTPRLALGGLRAWADLYDERRAASLARAAVADDGTGPYPHRTFTDPAEARRWLAGFTP